MICAPCRKQDHEQCPNMDAGLVHTISSLHAARGKEPIPVPKPPTGLSPEGDAIQRSGLCPCQHKVAK